MLNRNKHICIFFNILCLLHEHNADISISYQDEHDNVFFVVAGSAATAVVIFLVNISLMPDPAIETTANNILFCFRFGNTFFYFTAISELFLCLFVLFVSLQKKRKCETILLNLFSLFRNNKIN